MSKNRKAQKIKAEIIRGELPIRKSDEPTGEPKSIKWTQKGEKN